MKKIGVLVPTKLQYDAAFVKEQAVVYPKITLLERRLGHAIAPQLLEETARVLACPLKPNPPNWQHGRVLWSVARDYQYRYPVKDGLINVLDIGTAKGFSALILLWATDLAKVTSIDVIDPHARVPRNTVTECDGLKTLAEILAPWPDAQSINFVQATSRDWLSSHTDRIHFAYVDGKHTYEAVSWDASLLSQRQQRGDVIVFDDLQIAGVNQAVSELKGYDVERVFALATRGYAIARKR